MNENYILVINNFYFFVGFGTPPLNRLIANEFQNDINDHWKVPATGVSDLKYVT